MQALSAFLSTSARVLLASCCIWIGACRESPRDAESDHSETTAAQEASSAVEEVTALRREIQEREQTVEDLQAAVDMERAKLEEDPDYDQSFLLDVLEEQEELRESIKADMKRLEAISRSGGQD